MVPEKLVEACGNNTIDTSIAHVLPHVCVCVLMHVHAVYAHYI